MGNVTHYFYAFQLVVPYIGHIFTILLKRFSLPENHKRVVTNIHIFGRNLVGNEQTKYVLFNTIKAKFFG